MTDAPANEGGLWGLWSKVKATGEQLEKQVGTYLADAPDNEAIKARLAQWGTTAGQYIDKADRQLEAMENNAISSFKTVGRDLQTAVTDLANGDGKDQKGGVLFAAEHIPTNRLDAELHQLHVDSQLYLNKEALKGSVDEFTDKIASYLAEYPDLKKLFEELVPEKVKYDQFWLRYFHERDAVETNDRKRKALLSRPAAAEDGKTDAKPEKKDGGDSDSDWE